MRRRMEFATWLIVGTLMVVFASGYGCSSDPLACEPSGTYPGGVRVHGSQLCN